MTMAGSGDPEIQLDRQTRRMQLFQPGGRAAGLAHAHCAIWKRPPARKQTVAGCVRFVRFPRRPIGAEWKYRMWNGQRRRP